MSGITKHGVIKSISIWRVTYRKIFTFIIILKKKICTYLKSVVVPMTYKWAILTPYLSANNFRKIQLDELDFWFLPNLNFAGYTVKIKFKLNRPKIKFIRLGFLNSIFSKIKCRLIKAFSCYILCCTLFAL